MLLKVFLQVITSSIDRSVKVWNLNNIFEQVHVIDRHELQIDSIRYKTDEDPISNLTELVFVSSSLAYVRQ